MQGEGGEQALESVFDYEPPGNLGSSGAWKVLRELTLTMSQCGLSSFLMTQHDSMH